MPKSQKTHNEASANTLTQEQLRRKRRLERRSMIATGAGLLILTLVQHKIVDLGPGLSESQGLVALVSINVSVLLTTLLILLILRNLYRIFFETHGYGSLQAKMVVAFICLSLLPTLLIFYYSYRQLVRGHDLWFSSQIEETLQSSIDLTNASLAMDNRILSAYGEDILDRAYNQLDDLSSDPGLSIFLENNRSRFHLTCVELYTSEGKMLKRAGDYSLPPIYHDWFAQRSSYDAPWRNIVEAETGELTRLVWPVLNPQTNSQDEIYGYLAVGRLDPEPIRSQMEDVRHGLASYRNALKVQRPFRVTQLTALTALTMLAIFISIWIGSHLAQSLARPVTELVEGTKKVAAGDWEFTLTIPSGGSGEFIALVKSFNQMTEELQKTYIELDRRRRFLETVLKNVSTGVIVLDSNGKPMHFNEAARNILHGYDLPERQDSKDFWLPETGNGLPLPLPLATLMDEALTSPRTPGRVTDRHIRLNVGETIISLRAGIAPLRNEGGDSSAYIMIFDDLTELEKAQRMSAWREVARRIAHEVKNPLTPIQLAAQRLRRRFLARLNEEQDAPIFEECTDVIIRKVDEMKTLVDEFSRFARLPETKPRPGDFMVMLEDSLALFRQAHKKVSFTLTVTNRPPTFAFDPEQMSRVITNIMNNSIAAMSQEGSINMTLSTDELTGLRLEIADTGPGVPPDLIDSIFEPHVTAKEGGQGLGLAIVRTIINDHGGVIRAKNIRGSGAKFTIELPLRG